MRKESEVDKKPDSDDDSLLSDEEDKPKSKASMSSLEDFAVDDEPQP